MSAWEDEGWGENGEWVSSGVGAAHDICPNQGHGPDSPGHFWLLISRGLLWALNRAVHSICLEISSPLGFRVPDSSSLVLPFSPLDLQMLEGPGVQSWALLYIYSPLGELT